MTLPLVVVLFLLAGCSEMTGEAQFKLLIEETQQLIKTENWVEIEQHVQQIDTYYNAVKWKLQLLGDEDEYESLQESVNHLKQAAKLHETSDCEKELTTIETYVQQIYSL